MQIDLIQEQKRYIRWLSAMENGITGFEDTEYLDQN